jgi:hypothetical protein
MARARGEQDDKKQHGSVRNRPRVTGENQQELAGTKRRGRAL